MFKVIAIVATLILLGVVAFSLRDAAQSSAVEPITAAANLNLKVKAQSGVTVTVISLSNQMKQAMAAGNDQPVRAAIDAELAKLHEQVDDACSQLITLGDSQATVEQWLARVGWPEFQRLEADYHKASQP